MFSHLNHVVSESVKVLPQIVLTLSIFFSLKMYILTKRPITTQASMHANRIDSILPARSYDRISSTLLICL